MKKLIGLFIVLLVLGVVLMSSCRPPEIEGAVVNIQNGLYDKAFENLQEAVKKYPDNAEAWYLLGTLYGRKENFKKMNDAFDKSLAISDEFKDEIKQSRFSYFAENYNSALKNYYNKARETQDPQKRKKLFETAADKFLKAHLAQPERAEPLTPMSVSFLESGDTATAEKYLDQAVEMSPQNDTLMVTVGDFYYNANKIDRAKELYNKAISANPQNTLAHLAMGEIYANNEKWDKAIEQFEIGMKQDPDNPAIPMNVGIIYYNNERYKDAIPYLKKTIELQPENKDIHEILSISYLQRAQKFVDQFNETEKPEFKEKFMAIYNTALPFLQDAVEKFPKSTLLWNNLGVVYAQKGMKEKAEEAFEKQKQLEEEGA